MSQDAATALLKPDRPVVLYDDGCRFCRAMAELLYRLARPRDLAFLSWSSGLGQAWLHGMDPSVRDASMHLKLPDGTLLSGTGVFQATLSHSRGLKWLAWLGQRSHAVAVALAWSYGWAAGHRELLSSCVPNRPPVSRRPRLQ